MGRTRLGTCEVSHVADNHVLAVCGDLKIVDLVTCAQTSSTAMQDLVQVRMPICMAVKAWGLNRRNLVLFSSCNSTHVSAMQARA